MKEQIVNYLLQNNICPLLNVGTLYIVREPAKVIPGNKLISSPVQRIEYRQTTTGSSSFINFIAENTKQSELSAEQELRKFCSRLESLGDSEELDLPTLGHFTANPQGELRFVQSNLDDAFHPAVPAYRVIHENDTHQILVGDTETTNRVMTDFYNEEAPAKTARWWIWALVLFLVAMIAIFLYESNVRNGSFLETTSKFSLGWHPPLTKRAIKNKGFSLQT